MSTFQDQIDAYRAQLEAEKTAKAVTQEDQEQLLAQWDQVNEQMRDCQDRLEYLRTRLSEVAIECLDAGISQHVLADVSGFSRQRIYQIARRR